MLTFRSNTSLRKVCTERILEISFILKLLKRNPLSLMTFLYTIKINELKSDYKTCKKIKTNIAFITKILASVVSDIFSVMCD